MKVSSRPVLWTLLLATAMSPLAHAAWTWPLSDSVKNRHAAKTIHPTVQHTVRPLGSASLRVVRPLGGSRPMGKTILAKRPP